MSLQQQGPTTRTRRASISAALAASSVGPTLSSPLTLHGSDDSLAEMAQRDLDAALQLLTERAQYITGANGAAIALRRHGKKDMLCRAAAGSNVPELGALLSTEFGLSGESVRTRRPLRCDDAERDPRVNREGCRELGIASVVVMPVVNDDEVLGVFELFSGKANAFGERDLSTLQRLSQMVEIAVKLARTAEALPLPFTADLSTVGIPAAHDAAPGTTKTEGTAEYLPALETKSSAHDLTADKILEPPKPPAEVAAQPLLAETLVTEPAPVAATVAIPPAAPGIAPSEKPLAKDEPAKKPLFWSIAQSSAPAEPAAPAAQSLVPPVLRNLSSCQACGFPVSPGRILCVECEEKKWRGQLRGRKPLNTAHPHAAPSGRALAAAVASSAVAIPVVVPVPRAKAKPEAVVSKSAATSQTTVGLSRITKPAETSLPAFAVEPPAFTLSAGLPTESWLSSKKYILAALLLIAAAAAAVWFLR